MLRSHITGSANGKASSEPRGSQASYRRQSSGPRSFSGRVTDASLSIFRGINRFHVHLSPSPKRMELSLIHVADLVRGVVELAAGGERLASENGRSGQGCYYLAAPEVVTYREFGKRIASSLGRRVLVWRVRRPTLWVACRVANVAGRITNNPGMLNSDKYRETQVAAWTCSADKARLAIGFEPERSLDERIRETSHWYREHQWL